MSFDLVSLQKDVESRKYKTDPFQKKFVDFTLTKFDSTIENDLTDVTEQNISKLKKHFKMSICPTVLYQPTTLKQKRNQN